MMRTVYFDFSHDLPPSPGYQFGGFEQEHGATELRVRLPAGFLAPEIRFVHFDFQTSLGETIAGEPVEVADATVSTPLFQQLTQAGILQFQVIARGENDAVIAKTPIGKLIIEKSTYGDPVVINEQPYRVDQSILDCLDQAQQAAEQADAARQTILSKLPLQEADIADGAVTTDKLADGTVNAAKLADGAVSADKLADQSVTRDKLADRAVTGAALAKGAVRPEHTAFVFPSEWRVEGLTTHLDFQMGESPRVAVTGGSEYLLFQQYPVSDLSLLMLMLLDADGGLLRRVPVMSMETVRTTDIIYTEGRYIRVPEDCACMYMQIEPPADNPDVSMEVHYTVCPLRSTLTIPDLRVDAGQLAEAAVTTDTLLDRAVTMDKLAEDVREAIAGEVLLKQEDASGGSNNANHNLVSTGWRSFAGSESVLPLSAGKRLRFTLELTSTVNNQAFHSGCVELRSPYTGTEHKVSWDLPVRAAGVYEIEAKLTDFTGDAAAWDDIRDFQMYIYAEAPAAAGAYSIRVSRVRIVDTATLPDGAVTTGKLADGAVTADKLADRYYTAAEVDGLIAALRAEMAAPEGDGV